MRRYSETPFSLISLLLDVVESLLVVRFALAFLGANPGNPIVSFVYAGTQPLVVPFRGIFPNSVIGGSVVEWHTLIAIVAYALFATLLVRLLAVFAEAAAGEEIREHVHHHRRPGYHA